MEFISAPFVVCFIFTFMLYYVKLDRRWQHAVLLLSSSVFIGYYHILYLVVAWCVTFFTFWAGRVLYKYLNTPKAVWVLWAGIFILVGFWLMARYYSPLFPLGLSFYTFQALSYLIGIYWEEDPEKDFWDFSLYMMLFMKFLSGPIERSYDMLPQLKLSKAFDYDKVTKGLKLIAWGTFLKLVIADRIGPALDIVFDNVQDATNIQMLVATLLYPLQLYADFAGYTLMALGLGRMMGFELKPNFNRPFISQSTGELWRRWHMTLSFWVRDYVFSPLNILLRSIGKWGLGLSLLVTFAAIGVWHGAGWTFVLYGLFQGIIILYEMMAAPFRNKIKGFIGNGGWRFIMILRTYLLFAFSLLFFRVSRFNDVWYMYGNMFRPESFSIKELRLGMSDFDWIVFGIAVLLMFLIEYLNSKHDLLERCVQLKPVVRWSSYICLVLIIFLFGAFGVENFIYIQF